MKGAKLTLARVLKVLLDKGYVKWDDEYYGVLNLTSKGSYELVKQRKDQLELFKERN